MKNLKDYLNIQKPVSTNLIPFYNTSNLDRALSNELNAMLDDREITFGMLPDMEEKRKIYEDILRRVGDVDNFDFQLPLYENYKVFDPPGTTSYWSLTPFDSVIQGIEIESNEPGKFQNLGTVLVGKEDIGDSVTSISADMKVASKGEVGIVFNFKDYDDFWIVSYANDKSDTNVPNALIVKRVLYGFVSEFGRGVPIDADLTNQLVEIEVEKSGGELKARVKSKNTDASGDTNPKLLIHRIKCISSTEIGSDEPYLQNENNSEIIWKGSMSSGTTIEINKQLEFTSAASIVLKEEDSAVFGQDDFIGRLSVGKTAVTEASKVLSSSGGSYEIVYSVLNVPSYQLESEITITNIDFLSKSYCGLYSQNNGDTEFYNLMAGKADGSVKVYPFTTELLKLTAERYERQFDIYNVDLRPMSWLATFKRLWAEKFFAKDRLKLAEDIYSKVIGDKDENTDLLSISPEEVDNAEGRVRKAFEDYLSAEDKFQEFATFMSEAGVVVPKEQSQDTFKTIFSDDSTGNSISTIKQNVNASTYTTWKEFFYTCAVLKKNSNVSDLINPQKRDEIIQRGGEAAWNLHVKNTVAPLTTKTVEHAIPHYRFVISNIGDRIVVDNKECVVVSKFWKTNQTRADLLDTSKTPATPFSIEISNVNEVATTIKEIMSPEGNTTNVESDIREYKEMDGALIDQYGVTLQDHVIHLTENYSDKVNNVLIVPIYETNESVRPDRVMVIKNPVFSGKQLHPASVHFNEKYTMDVRWDGIGLGEFSHSVNLFPGEERELKIVSSKKKSWETVSKTKTSTKASSSSETTNSSKRNDSFSSKLSDSMDRSSSFSSSRSTKSKASVTVKAKGGFGPFSASASASYSRDSSSESSSKLSSVSKRASELASQSGSEVSDNNKVAFSSTTDTESSLESKVAGEDMETETSTIKLYNINEGKTANYNFYQVTNIYNTAVGIENVTITVDTGIEIIPGTGLTISKEFELENFADIYTEFFIYTEEEKRNLFKLVSAQILQRYMKLERDRIDDDPQILKTSRNKSVQDKISVLRSDVKKAMSDTLKKVALTKKSQDSLVDQLPDGLLDLRKYDYEIQALEIDSSHYYTINSGKYYVDAHLGHMPATEDYLEERRKIETDRQKALVNELKKRTDKGVFFPEFPENVQSLSFDGEGLDIHEHANINGKS